VPRLDDYYVWDSWVADDGKRYHLFFLQAPHDPQEIRLTGMSTLRLGMPRPGIL
jgi:hypothetical protein